MRFEVTFHRLLTLSAMSNAGVDTRGLEQPCPDGSTDSPATVVCPNWRTNPATELRVTRHFQPEADLERVGFEIDDEAAGECLRAALLHYSASQEDTALLNAQRNSFWKDLDAVLSASGVSRRDLFQQHDGRPVCLKRETLEALMRLYNGSTNPYRGAVFQVLEYPMLSRADRRTVARWLLDVFVREWRSSGVQDALTTTLTRWILPEMGEELIPMILDRRYGGNRCGLCDALVRTRHPLAAEVLAEVIDEPRMTWSGLNGLGRLRATPYVPLVQRYLSHSSKDIRNEARTTLKKMGVPV